MFFWCAFDCEFCNANAPIAPLPPPVAVRPNHSFHDVTTRPDTFICRSTVICSSLEPADFPVQSNRIACVPFPSRFVVNAGDPIVFPGKSAIA